MRQLTMHQNGNMLPGLRWHVLLALLSAIQLNNSSSSFLSLGLNECFERVSVGKRLNTSDVNRSIKTQTLKQCNLECERKMCNAYAFGIDPQGNGTCDISAKLPVSPPNEDPDFDLFIRVLQCRNTIMCFKRLVSGRRLIDRYIRRTFPSDSLARCQMACTMEREFICDGFNYRFARNSDMANSCQLTAMPSSHLDLTLDFISDYDYDFYERDRNGPPDCGHLSYRTWQYDGYLPQTKVVVKPVTVAPQRPQLDSGAGQQIPLATYHPSANGRWQPKITALPAPVDDYLYNTVKVQHRLGEGDSIAANPKWNNNGYECFVRARTSFRLDRRVVVLTLNAPTLYDCELVCANEKKFMCNILTYRYSTLPSTDNCQLGEKTFRQLDTYFDLIPDRNYDIYVRNEYSRPGCQPKRTWDSDCFERIRSGLTLEKSMVKFSVNTESLIECELICLHVRHFTCRTFSFRYDAPSSTYYTPYNCLLTDVPIPEMDPRKHFTPDSDCELYHRASYGHGCELDQWSFNMNSPMFPSSPSRPPSAWPLPSSTYVPKTSTSTVPFFPVPQPPTKPSPTNPYTPDSRTELPATDFAGSPPSRPHNYSPDNPLLLIPSLAFKPYLSRRTYFDPSYSGRLPAAPPIYTTYTKDKPPLLHHPHLHNTYDFNPTFSNKNDKLCYITHGTPARLLPSAIRISILVVSEQECKAECSKARKSAHFKCVTLSYWSGHCEMSDIELRDLKPNVDFVQDDTYWLFSWDFTDTRCYFPQSNPPSPGITFYPDTIWSSFTVSGQRCSRGTFCTHSAQIGIWSCPIDNGDWDYCCRPGHHCGYSEGYNYPWCYVGTVSKEQWRPCSDFYYPYEHGDTDRALRWPISYLHKYSPPNITVLHHQHRPSVLDNFLQSLKISTNNQKLQQLPRFNDSGELLHAPYNKSVIEFQVIDVTENSQIVIQPKSKDQSDLTKFQIWTGTNSSNSVYGNGSNADQDDENIDVNRQNRNGSLEPAAAIGFASNEAAAIGRMRHGNNNNGANVVRYSKDNERAKLHQLFSNI